MFSVRGLYSKCNTNGVVRGTPVSVGVSNALTQLQYEIDATKYLLSSLLSDNVIYIHPFEAVWLFLQRD